LQSAPPPDFASPAGADAERAEPTPSPWQRIRRFFRRLFGGGQDVSASSQIPAAVVQPTPPDELGPRDLPLGPNSDPFGHGEPDRFSAINLADTRASSEPWGEVITPQMYAECYTLCRAAIHSVPGHEDDQVLIGAVAPWNNQTKYPENPNGDWIIYFRDILTLLGPQSCDGMAIHTYTHGSDPNLITSDAKMNPPFQNRHFEFRTYRDFMNAIPGDMRDLPVYITETDQDVPWLDQNTGWVQRAYGEIDYWNQQPGNQQIRSLVLYRWLQYDKWYIKGKDGVIEDFRQAMQFEYRWNDAPGPQPLPLNSGDTVRTLEGVNMRRTPGYQNKPANDVLFTVPAGQTAVVVSDTSQSADGLIWWNVRTAGANNQPLTGWLAQSAPNGVALIEKVETNGGNGTGENGIQVGGQARTTTQVRLRQTPGYANKPSDDVITTMPPDAIVAVLDGPRSADGLTWWRVRGPGATGTTVEGWMAETAPNGVVLMESIPDRGENGGAGGTFAPGDRARTLTVVRMRRTPGIVDKPPSDVIADVPTDTTVTIVDGPQTMDDLTWWQVNAPVSGQQATGWMAEVAPGGQQLLAPVAAPPPPPPPPEPEFEVGDRIQTLDSVRLRRTPGFFDKPTSDVVTTLPPGTVATITGGPQQEDDLTWWLVETRTPSNQSVRGWLAQSAPNGIVLIELVDEQEPPADTGRFAPGELVVVQTPARVRQTPGITNKPDGDVLGELPERTTVNIIAGPREVDDLTWWRVGGITTTGEAIGWTAESVNGIPLLARAAKLPGTNIPDRATNSFLNPPTARPFGIAQLWGENPDFYRQFSYGGVPLQGHNGIDFLTPVGTEIFSVDAGTVIQVDFDPTGFGNYVMVRHPWGQSIYAHLEQVAVREGQVVGRGAFLGLSGNTGASTGPHLHFAIRIDPFNVADGWGGFSDPLPYLPPEFVILPDYVLPSEAARAAGEEVPIPTIRLAPSPVTVDLLE
jgi:hypothetical protein